MSMGAGYRHQAVLNGRTVPERGLQVDAREPLPVLIRVHWESDGWETMAGFALGWMNRRGFEPIVRVHIPDPRTTFCWVPACDVRRAGEGP